MPLCERCMQYNRQTEIEEGEIYDMDNDGEDDAFLCRACLIKIEEDEKEFYEEEL